ncbi:MAG: RsmB/NOP family class I SAM-dependent RNA methyltransferase [Bacteroidetes bacterium]|nr:RsmB/NOP family class I SAM-dependent RNA methyltransferase [Bacteroidota bacterium]
MFVDAYIQTATLVFNQYTLETPFAIYLKKYFKSAPQFGSRDRKYIAELVFGLFRLGNIQTALSLKERMLIGSFLSGQLPILFFEKTSPLFAQHYTLSFEDKFAFIQQHFAIKFNIPFQLTSDLTPGEYFHYLFQPSKVFIRIRSHYQELLNILTKNEIPFEIYADSCIALPQKTKIQELFTQHDAYVVQDISSQMAMPHLQPMPNERWWDCCAASGGKTLLLLDKKIPIDLTATDIRPSIIANLRKRLAVYHFHQYRAFVADAAKPLIPAQTFDQIIADVPCSGAGTWRRNPEQYYYFDENKLKAYHTLQQSILHNALNHLKPGGYLYYFTCSIFEQENEAIIHSIDKNYFSIIQQKLLNGFGMGGDCLFFCKIQRTP